MPLTTRSPFDIADLLPASCRSKGHQLLDPSSQPEEFLENDLSVKTLEKVFRHLWLAGLPYLPRPLNIQLVLGRRIVPTTDVSLHLVWSSGRIFIKPLPPYLLYKEFYDQYQTYTKIHSDALGLLHSYLALIPTQLDFALAVEAKLLPFDVSWQEWKVLANRILQKYPDNDIYQHIPKRYCYGELRLSRLDKIYCFLYGEWLHGYSMLTGSSSYAEFFVTNLAPFAGLTIYIFILLNAMAVGLATKDLKAEAAFQRACYGFTIFAMIAPIAILVLMALIFLGIFITNWSRTRSKRKKRSEALGVKLSNGLQNSRKNRASAQTYQITNNV